MGEGEGEREGRGEREEMREYKGKIEGRKLKN